MAQRLGRTVLISAFSWRFGDYTDMAAGSDNVLHAFWTDSNNEQSVVWWYGLQFVPTLIHQQDVVTGVGP